MNYIELNLIKLCAESIAYRLNFTINITYNAISNHGGLLGVDYNNIDELKDEFPDAVVVYNLSVDEYNFESSSPLLIDCYLNFLNYFKNIGD